MILALALIALAQAPDAPLKQGTHACGTVEADAEARGCTKVLNVGETAPFAGILLDEQEDVRRDNVKKNLEGQLKKAQTDYVLLPKPAVGALIALTAAAIATALALGVAAAEHKI